MQNLPVELLAEIFHQLKLKYDQGSLWCASRVCRRWREASRRFLGSQPLRLTCITGFQSDKKFFIAFGSKEGVIDIWELRSHSGILSHNIYGTHRNREFDFYLDPSVDYIASKGSDDQNLTNTNNNNNNNNNNKINNSTSYIVSGNITDSDIRCWEFKHSEVNSTLEQLWQRIVPKDEPVKSLNAIQIRDQVIYSGWFYSVVQLDLKTGNTIGKFINDPFQFMDTMITKNTVSLGDKIIVRHPYENTDKIRALELKEIVQGQKSSNNSNNRNNRKNNNVLVERSLGSWTLQKSRQKEGEELVLFKYFRDRKVVVIVDNSNWVFFGIEK